MIRSLLLTLILAAPAYAQEIIYVPVQCCPGGQCYPPQYQYQCPPQRQYSPPVGSPGTPRFSPDETPPLPPQEPQKPSPWATSQEDWLKWCEEQRGANKAELVALSEINKSIAELPQCDCDNSGLAIKLEAIAKAELALAQKIEVLNQTILQTQPPPSPAEQVGPAYYDIVPRK